MPPQEEIVGQQELLEASRLTLHHYLLRLSKVGTANATPEIRHGIIEARENILRIKKTLREWAVLVEDRPDDEEVLELGAKPTPDVDFGHYAEGKNDSRNRINNSNPGYFVNLSVHRMHVLLDYLFICAFIILAYGIATTIAYYVFEAIKSLLDTNLTEHPFLKSGVAYTQIGLVLLSTTGASIHCIVSAYSHIKSGSDFPESRI